MTDLAMSDKDRAAYVVADDSEFPLSEDSLPHDGVPQGRLLTGRLDPSAVYPGNEHEWSLYVPARYEPGVPTRLLVVLDGNQLRETLRIPVVLDNLIHRGDLPAVLALFVEPGAHGPGLPIYGGTGNRSVEYDSTNDAIARFVVDELLPGATRGFTISADPGHRAVLGASSGGVAAFTVAWHRPDQFRNVISLIGSFTNIRGAHAYPSLIRRTEPKPLRVFLHSGRHDLDTVFGNWPIANQDMAAALAYRDYDHRFVFDDSGHSSRHAAPLIPDALRWLWHEPP